MEGHLITVDGESHEVTVAKLRELKDSSTRYWLDLAGLDQATAETVLHDTFAFHPVAVEDAEHFGPAIGRLFDMKRSLIAMRKVVTPQRDMFAAVLSEPDVLPGMTPDSERYFRDLYDHLIRISDLVDSYRDLLSGALDTHLSTVSNRLNVIMKQLTIIATIFLPLSFLTGFFGQNFGWMVNRLTSLPAYADLVSVCRSSPWSPWSCCSGSGVG